MTSSKSYLSPITSYHLTAITGLIASVLSIGCPQETPIEMPPDSPPTTPIPDTKGCSPTNVFPFADAVSSSVFDETHIGRGVVSGANRMAIPYLTKQSTPSLGLNYRLGVRLNSMSTDGWQDFVAVSDQALSSVINKAPVLMNIQGKLHLFFQGRQPSDSSDKIFESILLDSGSFSSLMPINLISPGIFNSNSNTIFAQGADGRTIALYSYYDTNWKIAASERVDPNGSWTPQALDIAGYPNGNTPFYVAYDQDNTVWAVVEESGYVFSVIHRVGGSWIKQGSLSFGSDAQPYNADFILTKRNGVKGIFMVWPELISVQFNIKTSFFDLTAKTFSPVAMLLTNTGGVNYPRVSIAVNLEGTGKILIGQQNIGNTGNQFWQVPMIQGIAGMASPALSSVEVKSRVDAFLNGCGTPSSVIITSSPGGNTDVTKAQLFSF